MVAGKARKASVQTQAETLGEALAMAAAELGTDVESLEHTVVQKGTRGILGLGRKPFVVMASTTVGDVSCRATRQGLFVRVVPPLTLVQAERSLASRGHSVDAARLAGALAATPGEWFRVGSADPSQEPAATITIATDEMFASLEMPAPAPGGLMCELQDILELLAARGVERGIDEAAIQDALENERFGEHIIVARGLPAEEGVDAKIRYDFRADKSHVNLVEDEHGHVDFHELGLFDSVEVGQLLAEKQPATPAGAPGWTVRGRALTGRNGVDEVKLTAGKNTALSSSGSALTSTIAGQVVLLASAVNVEALLDIKGNVDFNTGNIDSSGSVIVRGNVTSGFHVRAQGNIDVYGLVEAAELDAKADIVIRKGVLGKGTSVIRAGGDVFAKFADRTTIHAGRDAVIGGEVLTSTLNAGRNVRCEGEHGSIIGGVIRAQGSVTASTIGSRLGVATLIEAIDSITGKKIVFHGVRLKIKDAKLEVQDAERAARFVERDGEVLRVPIV